jgi:hypothetical protein
MAIHGQQKKAASALKHSIRTYLTMIVNEETLIYMKLNTIQNKPRWGIYRYNNTGVKYVLGVYYIDDGR